RSHERRLDEAHRSARAPTVPAPGARMSLLEVDSLEAGYDDALVLHGVSLVADANEIVAVIGPNGAGKSTMLKAVYGLVTRRARACSRRAAAAAAARRAVRRALAAGDGRRVREARRDQLARDRDRDGRAERPTRARARAPGLRPRRRSQRNRGERCRPASRSA